MLMSPNAIQSPMMTSALGTSPAIVGGVRKIPEPMVMPTMSAVPPVSPMTRRRSCVGDWTADMCPILSLFLQKRALGCEKQVLRYARCARFAQDDRLARPLRKEREKKEVAARK